MRTSSSHRTGRHEHQEQARQESRDRTTAKRCRIEYRRRPTPLREPFSLRVPKSPGSGYVGARAGAAICFTAWACVRPTRSQRPFGRAIAPTNVASQVLCATPFVSHEPGNTGHNAVCVPYTGHKIICFPLTTEFWRQTASSLISGIQIGFLITCPRPSTCLSHSCRMVESTGRYQCRNVAPLAWLLASGLRMAK